MYTKQDVYLVKFQKVIPQEVRCVFILGQIEYMLDQTIYILGSAMQLPATDRRETDGNSSFDQHIYK